MILKDIDINKLKDLFKAYKENYIITNNDYIHNICYVKDNEVIGFVIYQNLYDDIDIIDVFVKEEYRKQKIATKMLNEILNEKYNKITLEVNTNNISAINLYKKLGFEIISVREKYYFNDDAYIMQKK